MKTFRMLRHLLINYSLLSTISLSLSLISKVSHPHTYFLAKDLWDLESWLFPLLQKDALSFDSIIPTRHHEQGCSIVYAWTRRPLLTIEGNWFLPLKGAICYAATYPSSFKTNFLHRRFIWHVRFSLCLDLQEFFSSVCLWWQQRF